MYGATALKPSSLRSQAQSPQGNPEIYKIHTAPTTGLSLYWALQDYNQDSYNPPTYKVPRHFS